MLYSIIIPTYNSEQFINKCLDSVITQTDKNFECIIVDDCSTDNTFNILKDYEKKYSNIIKVYQNEINCGCGITRKKAISLTNGDYIVFLDSDDWIETDYIEQIKKIQQKTNSDFISTSIIIENNELNPTEFPKDDRLQYNDELYKQGCNKDFSFMNIGKIVNKKLFNHISYNESRFAEDGMTFEKSAYYANSLFYSKYKGYHYNLQDLSLCHKSTSIKNVFYLILNAVELYDFYKDKEDSPLHQKYSLRRTKNALFRLFPENEWKFYTNDEEKLKYSKDIIRLMELLKNNSELLPYYQKEINDVYNDMTKFVNIKNKG